MKKFFILVLGMIMLMLIPINVKADDEVEIGVDQEESYGWEGINCLFKDGDAYDLEKIHITRMATNQRILSKG